MSFDGRPGLPLLEGGDVKVKKITGTGDSAKGQRVPPIPQNAEERTRRSRVAASIPFWGRPPCYWHADTGADSRAFPWAKEKKQSVIATNAYKAFCVMAAGHTRCLLSKNTGVATRLGQQQNNNSHDPL